MYLKKNTLCFLLALFLVLQLLSISAYASTDNSPVKEETIGSTETQIPEELGSSNYEETSSQNNDTPGINIVQIITSFGVIATAMLGVANLVTSVRKIHIDGISNKRVQWIESVRDITASIVCYDLRKVSDESQFEKEYGELLKNAYKLSLYLNIHGKFDRVVSDYLIKFVKSQHQRSDDFVHNRRMLNFTVQVYLKSEWNRVKCESSIYSSRAYDEKENIMSILKSLKGRYVEELQQEYKKYLTGKAMDAPVFFEFIDLGG